MDVVPSGKRRWNHKQKESNTLILQHGKRTNLAKNAFGIKYLRPSVKRRNRPNYSL
jgi:hypothetical protein